MPKSVNVAVPLRSLVATNDCNPNPPALCLAKIVALIRTSFHGTRFSPKSTMDMAGTVLHVGSWVAMKLQDARAQHPVGRTAILSFTPMPIDTWMGLESILGKRSVS